MKISDFKKKRKYKESKTVACRLSKKDYDFIKKNRLSVRLIVERTISKLKKRRVKE